MTDKLREHFNLTNILLAIVLGIAGWTLKTVQDLTVVTASMSVRITSVEHFTEQNRQDLRDHISMTTGTVPMTRLP